jgi:hypothetical protein
MYSTVILLIFYTYKYGDIVCVVSNISGLLSVWQKGWKISY